jgi:TPR repeat protein
MNMEGISLEAAIAVTERSRRTWWRRIAEGEVTRVEDDARGRTLLAWDEVVAHLCVPMAPEDLSQVLRADAGDAEAQNDVGQIFSNAGKPKSALYWFQLATQQGHPDAMQWLGRCYLGGEGVHKDENLGVMWIANAAAHGHVIAQAQMNGLRPRP